MVQLPLRAEKFIDEKRPRGSFQKRKGLSFMSGQSLKKSHSYESSRNSSLSGTDSVNSP